MLIKFIKLVTLLALAFCLFTYLALIALDIFSPSLKMQHGRLLSLDLPRQNQSRIFDIMLRPPIAVLARIPEELQVELGLTLFLGQFTAGLSQAQVDRIHESVDKIYEEIATKDTWRDLPSSTGYSSLDLLGIEPQRAHAYVYVPRLSGSRPKHAVVFLHGSLGNLEAYPYIWSKFADQTESIIICPSFGFGNWSREQSIVETVLEALPENLKVGKSQSIVVGLSAGGYGVVSELGKHPDYAAAVFISAVIPSDKIATPRFAQVWNNKPVLILNGNADEVVSSDYALKKARELNLLSPSVKIYQGESHFLLLTSYKQIFAEIKNITDKL